MDRAQAYAVLGTAIRGDRERQGLTRADVAARVAKRGAQVSARSIGSLESGVVPKREAKPPTLEPTVAALGWLPGWTDRILAGEDPSAVLQRREVPDASPREVEVPDTSPREHLLELLPVMYDFGRIAVRAGAPASLRDELERIVQQLLDAVPGGKPSRSSYALAAYRPHAVGEGVPADDAARIYGAIQQGS